MIEDNFIEDEQCFVVTSGVLPSYELREDGGYELREDGGKELR